MEYAHGHAETPAQYCANLLGSQVNKVTDRVMKSLVNHLDALTNAPTIETLWSLHTTRMAEMGFDRVLYGFTRYRSGVSLGDPQDWVVLTNHCNAYTDRFLGDGYIHDSPMARWALANDGACSWSWIADPANMTPAEQRVTDFNRAMGVTAGYTISFRAVSRRTKGAAALTARPGLGQDDVDAIWAEHGASLQVMSNVVYLKMLTLPHATRSLTKRQREVLEWVGDGKTTQDIATILGLTAATVEKHLRLAREALGVETTAQAVLKASFHNQMFVLEPDSLPA
jgi:LuxR family transcriptional regulator